MPCTHSNSSSSWVEWPALRACSAATCGHSTTSPSSPGSGPGSAAAPRSARAPAWCGGLSSSIGNASTSVGPGSPSQRSCRSAMAGLSTRSTESSTSGCTRIPSSTWRATAARPASSTAVPDSLAISMLTRPRSPGPGARAAGPAPGQPLRACRVVLACVVSLVGVHDVGHQLVPDDIVTSQPGEINIVDAVQYVLDQAQAAQLTGRQVDLRDVSGDDDPGAKAEPGQEHLHLLGRSVLRLVENDERVVQRAAPHVSERGNLNRPGRGQPRDRVGVEHVVQGIIERPEVRVDLFV